MTHIFAIKFNERLDYHNPNIYRRLRHFRHYKYQENAAKNWLFNIGDNHPPPPLGPQTKIFPIILLV